ncbi:MAG TPA: NADH-quinone oxidoreductase subunit J [Chloroflexia bacterium]|nr:NADH-quinone oxidoreductase subunit J [Chloroflexia bacterium]
MGVTSPVQLIAVIFFGLAAIWFALTVFRTRSMMRSALALLATMAALGGLFLALEAEFLGVLQIMMMATEMTIMAIFMVMFMMDPGGLGQMEMTHQKKLSIAAGVVAGLLVLALVLLTGWGQVVNTPPEPGKQVHDLGIELMTRSMMVFETAGVTILVAMICGTLTSIATRQK